MKKILLMMFLSVVLCLGMAGCGGDGGEEPEAEAPVAESVAGDWECSDMTMSEGGTEMAKDDLEELFGAEVKKLAHLTAYPDGTGEMLLLEETLPITWVETDEGYTLTITGDDAGAPMTATLADNQLSVKSKEGAMEMSFTFKYLGRTSVLIDGWDLQLTDEEVVEMSSFMAWGESIVVDDMLYGSFGGNTWEDGSFSAAKVKKDGVGDRAVMAEGVRASTLTEHDGYIYGALGNAEIIKVEAGDSKYETVYKGACDYVQVYGDRIYFTDENYTLCSIDMNGKDKKTEIDKKDMYYVYVLPNGMVIYQDDPDGESIHMYDLKAAKDHKLTDVVSHNPVICGDYLYYTEAAGGEAYEFCRLDLYSGKLDKAPGTMDNSEFFIENGKIIFGTGGYPALALEDWNKLDETNHMGLVLEVRSSNGEVKIMSDSTGEMYLRHAAFDEEGENFKIGY
ncbi:MAG: DUF5050 domain-containing protein [Firmicutes bacterium]|nr:DUF5050 domain-containing protein [Bacillota bacterium]